MKNLLENLPESIYCMLSYKKHSPPPPFATRLLCGCLLLLLYTTAFSQVERRFYEMMALGSSIGTADISRHEDGNAVHYYNHTQVTVNLLVKKIHMEVKNEAHYHGGQLTFAQNIVHINGELHSSSHIQWQGHEYRILINDEPQEPHKGPITFSGSLLYFQEPIGRTEAFAESSGAIMTIVPLEEEGAYRITDPLNERDMVRRYENGTLVYTKLKHPLVNMHMYLKDPPPD